MRSYRNRLMIETGAANPAARSLDIPEELMGETMRQVITHEVGHALGLPHNMIASSSFPVDSLRSASFTRTLRRVGDDHGLRAAELRRAAGRRPEPKDFIRRLGPFDDFVINWGYRVFPRRAHAAGRARRCSTACCREQTGPMPYRYVPQYLSGIDPRSQTEDIGDDPVAATAVRAGEPASA